MKNFFANSLLADHMIARPLAHIKRNWELTWDTRKQEYRTEDDSYAAVFNVLIDELNHSIPPKKYHDNEDCLAEHVRTSLKWPLRKEGNRWVGADYTSILEQGGLKDIDEKNLILAASGRIQAAKARGQSNFDDMEESHRRMLAAVISIILFHRSE